MNIKYSIVIPTRNRAEYVKYAIQSVLKSPRKDIELIVSNNFSSDLTKEVLSKITDSRLKVISPDFALPMAGHYEFAISKARGEWITILGDDDALMPYFFISLDKYIKNFPNVDIISSARAYYFWKGCEDRYGEIVVNYNLKFNSQLRSTKKDLMSVIKGSRSCFDMPQIYTTCIIKRELFEEIKFNSGGNFYHSIIPDMYSVMALCLSRDKYLRIEEPLFWVGTSNKSIGRADLIYKDAKSFNANKKNNHINIPTEISNDVSYILHSNKFHPMYMLECFLKTPLNKSSYNTKKTKAIVLASVLNILKKRSKIQKKKLIKELYRECKRYNITYSELYFKAVILFFENSFFILKDRIVNILYQKNFMKSLKLKSNQRAKYPTILEASNAVDALINQKK